jgi:hypothetical protein
MKRILLITALLAFVAIILAPSYAAVIPHHDGATLPHAAEENDCGCGCMCHVAVDAVATADYIEIHLISLSVFHPATHSLPDPFPASLDRPPELVS